MATIHPHCLKCHDPNELWWQTNKEGIQLIKCYPNNNTSCLVNLTSIQKLGQSGCKNVQPVEPTVFH